MLADCVDKSRSVWIFRGALKLFIAEIEQLLKNQHLEEDQRINPLSPRVALPLMRVSFLQQ
jgi:hypothetical protein